MGSSYPVGHASGSVRDPDRILAHAQRLSHDRCMSVPNPEHIATLLVSCPDRRGLVAALGQLLYGHGGNILEADQYSDLSSAQFFQRITFDMSELHTDRVGLEQAIAEVAQRFSMRYRLSYRAKRKRVALLVSQYDHCMQELLWRAQGGDLDCDIRLVLSNHTKLAPLAQHHGIPFHHLPVTKQSKQEQEAALRAHIENESIDLVVLARYMQILSAEFCRDYEERVINIHHSFLPAFVGGRPYHRAHERGVKIIGATAHYATADLDEGPIIEQDVTRVSHRETVQDLIRQGRDMERLVLARAVRLHLEDRIIVHRNKTVVFS